MGSGGTSRGALPNVDSRRTPCSHQDPRGQGTPCPRVSVLARRHAGSDLQPGTRSPLTTGSGESRSHRPLPRGEGPEHALAGFRPVGKQDRPDPAHRLLEHFQFAVAQILQR